MTTASEILTHEQIAEQRADRAIVMQEKAFELLQRRAKLLASSRLLPDTFKNNVGDCAIIIEMAERLNVDAFMLARQIYMVANKPAFFTKFAVSLLHRSGVIKGHLKYRTRGTPDTDDFSMQAYGIERISGDEMTGPFVSIKMAKAEGWFDKNGSKWKTMPDLMLQYRAASFFINTNCPEIMQGMSTVEELADIKDITPQKQPDARISRFADDPPATDTENQSRKPDGKAGEVFDHEPG